MSGPPRRLRDALDFLQGKRARYCWYCQKKCPTKATEELPLGWVHPAQGMRFFLGEDAVICPDCQEVMRPYRTKKE